MTKPLNHLLLWTLSVLHFVLYKPVQAQYPTHDLLKKAQIASQENKPDSALFYLRNAEIDFSQNSNYEGLVEVYTAYSELFGRMGQMNKAMANSQKAIDLANAQFGNDHVVYGRALQNEVGLSINLGAVVKAKSSLEKAIQIFEREDPNGENLAELYHDQGSVYLLMGRPQLALEAYNESLSRCLALYGEDHLQVVSAYESMGVIYAKQYYFEKALEYFDKATGIVEKIAGADHPKLARSLSNAANVYTMMGSTARSLENLHRALTIMKKKLPPGHPDIGRILLNLGVGHLYMGDYEPARTYLKQSLDIQEKVLGPGHYLPASTINNLGMVEMGDGRYAEAAQLLEKALRMREQIFGTSHLEVARTLMNLGELYTLQKDLAGLPLIQRSLDIRIALSGKNSPQVAETYNALGNLYLATGQLAEAKNAYQQSLSISLPGNTDLESLQLHELTKTPHTGLVLHSLGQLGLTLSKETQEENREEAMKASMTLFQICDSLIVQSRRDRSRHEDKLRLGETTRHIYDAAVGLGFDLYDLTRKDSHLHEAFYFMEMSKATLLAESLAEESARKFSGLPEAVLSFEKALVSELALHRSNLIRASGDSLAMEAEMNKIFECNQQLDSLVEVLEAEYPRYYDLKYRGKVVGVNALQAGLDADELLVNYHEADEAIYVLALSKKGVKAHIVDRNEHFEQSMDTFLEALTPNAQNQTNTQALMQYDHAAYQLYKSLLAPVLDDLPEHVHRLNIAPSGRYTYLPFELLISAPSEETTGFQELNYLIKDYEVSYVYAAGLLNRTDEAQVAGSKPSVLAMAPKYADRPLSVEAVNYANTRMYRGPLSWNQEEIARINALFPGEYLSGAKATEGAFKARSASHDVLHMAMHALVDNEDAGRSSLLFAQTSDEDEDGLLFTDELYGMDLSANMVVLSACNTGLGQVREGEGMMSLGRAMAYAGCASIVTSYWAVDDKSTSQLMALFYQELAEGSSKQAALRNAKLQYLEQARGLAAHPYYWGSFVLFGEAEPLVVKSTFRWFYGLLVLFLLSAFILYRRRTKAA